MKINFVMVADAAQVANGKLFILGGDWNVYRSGSYPTQAQMAIAFSVSFSPNEVGIKVPMKVVIADEAGIPILPEMQGQIEIGPPPEDQPVGAGPKLPFAINLGLQIPRPGKYEVKVTVGSSNHSVPFDAIFAGQKVELAFAASTRERGN
ncbi:MAG TPA: hypothetical protein VEF03_06125 [Candidatus Binataceae bacterium]|nr:hypothetical protein [Candidatus Binataceae bacterium]